jgi:hypothetical protein
MLTRVACFFVCLGFLSLRAQKDSLTGQIANTEAELQALQQKTFHSRTEAERFEGNRQFIELWDRITPIPSTLRYDFKMKDVSIITAPDNSFRIITWNIPKDDGTHVFFGYLLSEITKQEKKGIFKKEINREYQFYKLIDRSATIRSPENHSGGPEKWFGMLYTQIIPCDDYYTLIGWDGNNKLTTRKFIDVLFFRNGNPVFGKDVFRIPRKNPRRLMFEYSSEVTMSVKYDEKNHRIVYSHLASHQEGPLLEGQYQYYGPDGSYDALVMNKDKWEITEDLDARNEKSAKDKTWNNPKDPTPKNHKKIMPEKRAK